VYTRSEIHAVLRTFVASFTKELARSGRKHFWTRPMANRFQSLRDANRQYLIHGKDKVYKLLLNHNLSTQRDIKHYQTQYQLRHLST
jgi:hypothetical protein